MDVLGNLMTGFGQAVTPTNLLFAFLGVIVGTVVGVLPGIGPLGAMALLLSVTYGLGPTQALILFAGIYYGSMYGGSTTSILVNVPGESASVVTCLDGYRMAQKGRAGAALSIAAVGSFVAGTFSVIGLMLFAPPLASFALNFGPPEYFSLAVAGLVVLSGVGSGSTIKSLFMVCVGLAIATVGMDPVSSVNRFTFNNFALSQGFDFIPVAMGLFGISEVLTVAEESWKTSATKVTQVRFRELLLTGDELRRSVGPVLRGSFLGFFVGLIPGPAAVISSFGSYALEKRLSRSPQEFGRGAIEGVAGPESANNAAAGGAFVPLIALGIPFAPPTALVLSALLINGVVPGPAFIQREPVLFWTVIASMYIGNVMLLVLNLPLVGVFANILRVPKNVLMPFVVVFCIVGVYAVNNSIIDIWAMVVSGIGGYFLRKMRFDVAPLVLALVLERTLENSLRQSLVMTRGDLSVFVTRPISIVLLGVAAAVIIFRVTTALAAMRRKSQPQQSMGKV